MDVMGFSYKRGLNEEMAEVMVSRRSIPYASLIIIFILSILMTGMIL